jgi:hypothetical protein
MRRGRRTVVGVSSLVLGAFGLFGCAQETNCEELGDCGGDPTGFWLLGPQNTSCIEDLYEPPRDEHLSGRDIVARRLPIPEESFQDWCGGLVATEDNILRQTPQFFTESAPGGFANIESLPDGTYSVGFSRTGTYYLDFPATCMVQYGARPDRPAIDLQGNTDGIPVNLCKQLELPLRGSGEGEGAYWHTTCEPNPEDPGGCICGFDVLEIGRGSFGTYRLISNNEILHIPDSPGFAKTVTYCRQGGQLELTGTDGAYLFDFPGLRNMSMTYVDCADGVQGPGEDGVDCGVLACGAACP